MDWGVFLDARAAPVYLASLLMLALAAWLLALDFTSRVNRAFALFLVFRAGGIGLATTSGLAAADPLESDYWSRVGGYFYLAAFVAFVRFVSIYPKPLPWLGTSRAGGWALLGVGVALEVAYFLDKCVWSCAYPPDPNFSYLGPLSVLSIILATSVAGLALVREHVRAARGGERRDSLLLVGGVLVANGLFDGLRGVVDVALSGWFDLASLGLAASPWAWPNLVSTPLAVAPAAAAVVLLLRHWSGRPEHARTRIVFLAVTGAAVTSGLVVGVVSAGFVVRDWGIAVLGLWRVAIPLVVTYAIVRHQLFGLDVKLKWTIRRGAVAGAFVGVFFLVSEAAEGLVADQYGEVVGLAAAGALTFAARPLEAAAERLANALLPNARDPRRGSADEKLDTYREALRRTLADGHLTAEEERYLDRLAKAMGISPDVARALRRGVEAEAAPRAAAAAPA